jgi:hypothetical protein
VPSHPPLDRGPGQAEKGAGIDKPETSLKQGQPLERFTALPDDETLDATVVALEEHGFSVEASMTSTLRATPCSLISPKARP